MTFPGDRIHCLSIPILHFISRFSKQYLFAVGSFKGLNNSFREACFPSASKYSYRIRIGNVQCTSNRNWSDVTRNTYSTQNFHNGEMNLLYAFRLTYLSKSFDSWAHRSPKPLYYYNRGCNNREHYRITSGNVASDLLNVFNRV